MSLTVVGALLGGCGGGDGPEGATPAGGGTTTTGTDPTAGAAPDPIEVAPLPDLPDPAPARPCDGDAVRCVDASTGADGADGTAAAPFASVVDALAAGGDGVVVQVAAGEYAAPVELTSVTDVSLIGGFAAGGDFAARDPQANLTVLRGDAERPVITVVASSGVHVEGFRITGGGGFDDTFNIEGGGIYLDGETSDVAIVANQIEGNAVDHGDRPDETRGGGISSLGTDVRIIGNVIQGNRAGRGAGIALTGGGVIDHNVVLDNFAVGDHGGGMWLTGTVTVTANHIEGNSIGTEIGYGWGGGLIVFGDDGDATLQGNVVTGNYAESYGSGVFIDDGAHATLVGELYYANECPAEGGAGLFVDSGGTQATTVDVVHSTIAAHDCPDTAQGGNGIYAGTSGAEQDPTIEAPIVTVTSSILVGNAGSEVTVADVEMTITDTLSDEALDGEGNVVADPAFVDPAGGDFRLGAGSPATGAAADGTDLGFTGAR